MSTAAPPPMFSPGKAIPPPIKKLRAGGTPGGNDKISNDADSAIAKRRAELDKLKQQVQKPFVPPMNMSQGRGPPPAAGSGMSASQPPPSVPKPGNSIARVRNSDIFPSAPKSESTTPKQESKIPPPMAGHPETVARRLEQSFDSGTPSKPSTKAPPPLVKESGPPSQKIPSTGPPPKAGAPPNNLASPTVPQTKAPPIPQKQPSAPSPMPKDGPPAGPPKGRTSGPPAKGPPIGSPPAVPPNKAPPMGGPPSGPSGPGGANPFRAAPPASKVDHFPNQPNQKGPNKGVSFHPSVATPETKIPSVGVGFTPTPKETKQSNAGSTPFHSTGDKDKPKTTTFHSSVKSPSADVNSSKPPSTPYPKGIESVSTPMEKQATKASTAGHTPFPGAAMPSINTPTTPGATPNQSTSKPDSEPSTTSRGDLLNTMRKYADTPEKSKTPIGKSGGKNEVQTPQAETPTAPMTASKEKKVGFLSPVMPTPTMRPMMQTPMSVSKRVATPFPKSKLSVDEEVDQKYMEMAAECIPYEFIAENAVTYTVRRPFGLAVETDLWFSAGYLNSKMYQKKASALNPTTLELVAEIDCDGTLMALHGDVEVRHRPAGETRWKEFGNIKENERTLGNVTCIDSQAGEKEYSLDEICMGMLSVREHYCSSLQSTAEAFRRRKEELPSKRSITDDIGLDDTASLAKAPLVDANVGTEDLPQPKPEKLKDGNSPPSDESASDVLSAAVGWFFSTIFRTVWFIVVATPFNILYNIFILMVAAVILSIIRLYVADDFASMEFMQNRPGIL